MLFDHVGGKIGSIPSKDTAYFYRDALINWQVKAVWENESEQENAIRWANSLYSELESYFDGAYVNYSDPLLENWEKKYYGENYQRLMQIKSKWDPYNFFKYSQSIKVIPQI